MADTRWLIKGDPFDVQKKGMELSQGKAGFGYLLEMGLGKTGLTLNDFLCALEDKKVDHMIIVCPNSLKKNWKDECEKWGVTHKVYLWPDGPRYHNKKWTVNEPIIWVFNYEAMLFRGGEVLEQFLMDNRCMMVLDESSRIKNFNSRTTKAIIAMSKRAPMRRALTGTPMSQSVMDLWPQLRFLGELNGFNPYAFRNHFGITGGFMGKQVIGVKNEQELSDILSKCAFIAKKKDWADLPAKMYTQRYVEMTKIQEKHYREMKTDFLTMLTSKEVTAPMVVTQLNKLQQITRGFIYDEDGEVHHLVEPNKNPCIEVIREVIDDAEGKVIVMAHHRESVSMLYEQLYMFNPARIAGGMSDTELGDEKAKFNDQSDCRAIVTQISVGALGHTLLGQKGMDRCHTMAFFENTYSLEKRSQAEDRNHRWGQDEDCLYIDLIASPLDKKCVRALQNKESIVEAVMGGVNYD